MTNSGGPVVRPSRPDEREALLDLKCRIFPHLDRAHELQRWQWQFDDNPARAASGFEALVVDLDGEIVGMFTMIPHRIHIGDETRLALDGVDFSVDDRLRGQGLGRRLVQGWMNPQTCAFSFTTTPTDVSIHVMTGCGGTLLGSVNETVAHAYFVDGAHTTTGKRGRADAVAEEESFDADWDALWQAIRPHHPLILVRDARYLTWRYTGFPFATPTILKSRNADGQVTGGAVLLRHERYDRMYVAELMTRPDDVSALRGLLDAAVAAVRLSGLKILYHATRDPQQSTVLREAGFEPVPGDVPKFLGKLNDPPPGSGLNVTDWTVSLGDGDQLYDIGEPQ